MLNLVLTTDKLQLVTSAAVTVDVHASWVDLSGATVTPGKTNTAISTGTTTDIVAAPGASTVRNVKTLHIRNRHASTAVDVTVVFDANGTDYELHKTTLLAGECLQYVEGVGFAKMGSSFPDCRTKRLASDQSNSTTSLTEVAGLSLLTGVGTFAFEYLLIVQSAAATTGHRFSVNHDGTLTSFLAQVLWAGGTTAAADTLDQDFVAAGGQLLSGFMARAKSTAGWGTTLGVDTLGADCLYWIKGILDVSADGNIELWHGSEVAAQSTVKAGSGLILTRLAA